MEPTQSVAVFQATCSCYTISLRIITVGPHGRIDESIMIWDDFVQLPDARGVADFASSGLFDHLIMHRKNGCVCDNRILFYASGYEVASYRDRHNRSREMPQVPYNSPIEGVVAPAAIFAGPMLVQPFRTF